MNNEIGYFFVLFKECNTLVKVIKNQVLFFVEGKKNQSSSAGRSAQSPSATGSAVVDDFHRRLATASTNIASRITHDRV